MKAKTRREMESMEIFCRVQNGVVILEGEPQLPEGAVVCVSYPVARDPRQPDTGERVKFPLFPSARPGTLPLTADRTADLWRDDDVSS
jgi:hypothetical protein